MNLASVKWLRAGSFWMLSPRPKEKCPSDANGPGGHMVGRVTPCSRLRRGWRWPTAVDGAQYRRVRRRWAWKRNKKINKKNTFVPRRTRVSTHLQSPRSFSFGTTPRNRSRTVLAAAAFLVQHEYLLSVKRHASVRFAFLPIRFNVLEQTPHLFCPSSRRPTDFGCAVLTVYFKSSNTSACGTVVFLAPWTAYPTRTCYPVWAEYFRHNTNRPCADKRYAPVPKEEPHPTPVPCR